MIRATIITFSLAVLAGSALGEVPARPAPAQEPKKAAEDPEQVLKQAQKDYVDANFADARRRARSVLGGAPEVVKRAWRVLGAASCGLKEPAAVDEAYGNVDQHARQFITFVCTRNGLELVDGKFRLAAGRPAK